MTTNTQCPICNATNKIPTPDNPYTICQTCRHVQQVKVHNGEVYFQYSEDPQPSIFILPNGKVLWQSFRVKSIAPITRLLDYLRPDMPNVFYNADVKNLHELTKYICQAEEENGVMLPIGYDPDEGYLEYTTESNREIIIHELNDGYYIQVHYGIHGSYFFAYDVASILKDDSDEHDNTDQVNSDSYLEKVPKATQNNVTTNEMNTLETNALVKTLKNEGWPFANIATKIAHKDFETIDDVYETAYELIDHELDTPASSKKFIDEHDPYLEKLPQFIDQMEEKTIQEYARLLASTIFEKVAQKYLN